MTYILIVKQIISLLKQDHGNILHMAVYMRDLRIFHKNKSKELLKEKHNNMTPYELASHLNYCEFLGTDNETDAIFYEPSPTEKLLDSLDKNEPLNEKIIKMTYMRKYLNSFQGYKTRLIKISLNFFFSESKKISVIDLRDCIINKEDDKIIILFNDKEYKFKAHSSNELEQIYVLLTERKEREKMLNEILKQEKGVDFQNTKNELDVNCQNEYLYAFLIRLLAIKIQNKELNNLLQQIKPIKSYIQETQITEIQTNNSTALEDTESDESYYSSFEEEFFDVESPSYNFKIYRTSLPSKSCSSFEPLSSLQKLTEQFQNIDLINEKNDSYLLFEQVIIYSVASYSFFRKRTRPCFEAFIGETFSIKEKDFELYVEKTDQNTTNLIYINNLLTFSMSNDSVEIKIDNFVIRYTYNIKILAHNQREGFNGINQKVQFKMYCRKNNLTDSEKEVEKQDEVISNIHGQYNDSVDNIGYRNKQQSKMECLLYNTPLILKDLNEYDLLYDGIIHYQNGTIAGTISDRKRTIKVIKGCWYKSIIIKDIRTGEEYVKWTNDMTLMEDYYYFNMFTLQLNVSSNVLKSDSRKRDDIRAIEDGRVDLSRENHILLKNREKLRELENMTVKGVFFIKKENVWVFRGNESKEPVSFELN